MRNTANSGDTVPGVPTLPKEDLRRLTARKYTRPILDMLRVFLLLLAVIGGAIWSNNVILIIIAIPFIAALQHAISILQHDAVHSLLFPKRAINEWVGQWVLSYPIGFSLRYRTVHFLHHKELGSPTDPDLANYGPFPSRAKRFTSKFIGDFIGFGAVQQFFTSSVKSPSKKTKSISLRDLLAIASVQSIILLGFTVAGHPGFYFVLWLLPLVTFAKGFTQIRNLAEHLVRPHRVPVGSERLRTFTSTRVERFFFAPLNFNYHAEHHWYPTVPYYHLPELRRLLKSQAGYAIHADLSPGYIHTLRRAIG